jgi:two-component system, OmpR family, phosphate regulon sensor histidine kinase PhoR
MIFDKLGEPIRQKWVLVRPALLRLAAIVVVAGAVGVLFGAVAALWVAVACLATLVLIHTYYVALIGAWLDKPRLEDIPSGLGAWSEVFSGLYRARRASDRDQQRLLDNEERYRLTVAALPEGIVLVDPALQIEWCNPAAERHLGISLNADQGLRLTNLVRDPAFVDYLTSLRFEQALTFRPLANPGLALAVIVIEYEPSRSMVITRDITEAERVDAVRRDFVANVSHEMRTPLTVITGFVETLLDGEPRLDDVRRHHVELMQEQAMRMMRLIEDLLLLSGLESEARPRVEETIDAGALIRELGEEARALSKGRHVVTVEPGAASLTLVGSRDELRSAFGNLVSNAVRYTPAGGRITLRWRARPDGAAFEVEDTGIGVAPEHVSRLTERFYRVDKSRSRDTGGTGLGLAIVKHVLLRHQGTLDIKSQPGHGSTFSARLPAERVAGDSVRQREAA